MNSVEWRQGSPTVEDAQQHRRAHYMGQWAARDEASRIFIVEMIAIDGQISPPNISAMLIPETAYPKQVTMEFLTKSERVAKLWFRPLDNEGAPVSWPAATQPMLLGWPAIDARLQELERWPKLNCPDDEWRFCQAQRDLLLDVLRDAAARPNNKLVAGVLPLIVERLEKAEEQAHVSD